MHYSSCVVQKHLQKECQLRVHTHKCRFGGGPKLFDRGEGWASQEVGGCDILERCPKSLEKYTVVRKEANNFDRRHVN